MKILILLLFLSTLATPAAALEIEAPPVPEAGREWMPDHTDSLSGGLAQLIEKVLLQLRPDLQEASRISLGILATAMLVSILQSAGSGIKRPAEIAGTAAIASLLLLGTNSMIRLAADTVQELMEYGKLLLPVMTAALAAQGGVTGSAALYGGTAFFSAIAQNVMGQFLVPGIYLYLVLCTGSCVTGEDLLKRLGALLKSILCWFLKILMMVFTTYLGLTGVVSGTTDAAALKAAKVTMSSFVPVVGGVLADASEAVMVSAGLMKNAAGIYGIFAVLALFLHPFLMISVHYLVLKLTAGICAVFSTGRLTEVIEAFSGALGILLGMTASASIMVLISTVCFLKGTMS